MRSISEEALSYLRKRGCMKEMQESFGLFSQDYCIYIPRMSLAGKEIAFEIRSYKEDLKKKIKIDDEACESSPYLIGVEQQKSSLYSAKQVILVEGFFDMIAVLRVVNKEKTLVFSTGTAYFSDKEALFLKILNVPIFLASDNDETGRKALFVNSKLLTKNNVKNQPLSYVGGKDFSEVYEKRGDDGLKRNLLSFI